MDIHTKAHPVLIFNKHIENWDYSPDMVFFFTFLLLSFIYFFQLPFVILITHLPLHITKRTLCKKKKRKTER